LEPKTNFSPAFFASLVKRLDLKRNTLDGVAERALAENAFDYIYAILSSGTYRARYAEFLKIDFPRLPLPGNSDLFYALARLGEALVALHLMESPELENLISSYAGPEHPKVGRIGWSNDTVWIDAVKPKKGAADAKLTGSVGFRGVPEEVWGFHIGGYQVCEKWLKDRRGRTLTADDIAHYHRIVIALHETIRIMREIDEVIEAHGGWPDAFAMASVAKAAGG
jgi:predicted helicase